MPKVKLRKTREAIATASLQAKIDIGNEVLLQAKKITKDPFAFTDLGYINHDIYESGLLSESFIKGVTDNGVVIANTAENKGFRYPRKIRRGYNTKRGYRKGRPFYSRAIQRSKIGKIYMKNLKKTGLNVKINRLNDELF